MIFNDDTICAIATPHGNGAIAVLRVSGKDSLKILPKFFKATTKTKNFESWRVYHGIVVDLLGKETDEVLVTVFKNPKSYTGEDSFEIACHGNYTLATEILQIIQNCGSRLAEPGEFTLRALLNGRIDLAQAESVNALISAKSHLGRANSLKFVEGIFSAQIAKIRQELTDFLSSLELELDFSEEDVEFSTQEEKIAKLTSLSTTIQKLLETYSYSSVLKDGIRIVLAGKPNVGKSSVFNVLIGKKRAIISEIAGTTRDYIEGFLTISGVECTLVDTAGIHDSADFLEIEGIEFSHEQINDADLVLHIFDNLEDLHEGKEFFKKFHTIHVLNKADKLTEMPKLEDNQVLVSASTGNGLKELRMKISEFIQKLLPSEETIVITEKRHFECLSNASDFIEGACSTIEVGQTQEFTAEFIRGSISELETLLGKITDDDVLNNIFGNFCIGK